MIVIGCDTVAPQAWKNGGGSTRELLLRPAGTDWRLRISVADIDADGPFSALPGVGRHFTVIDGAVELTVSGPAPAATHRLKAGDPTLQFDGDADASCRLPGGSAKALNLMMRGVDGHVEPAVDGVTWTPGAGACGLYAAVAGHCNGIAVPAQSLVWLDSAPAGMRFDIDARQPPAGPIGWWFAVDNLEIRQ